MELGLNGQYSQMELCRHLEQTWPGLMCAIFSPIVSKSASRVFDMGFPKYHANLRSVALPNCDSSGVYAVAFTYILLMDFGQTCPILGTFWD